VADHFAGDLSRVEAIVKLTACRELAARLGTEGLGMTLTMEELAALDGFKQVWLAGFLEGNSHIYRQAGLSRGDIAALNRLLTLSQGQNMRRLHQSGDD
jgi:hypothetical protein